MVAELTATIFFLGFATFWYIIPQKNLTASKKPPKTQRPATTEPNGLWLRAFTLKALILYNFCKRFLHFWREGKAEWLELL